MIRSLLQIKKKLYFAGWPAKLPIGRQIFGILVLGVIIAGGFSLIGHGQSTFAATGVCAPGGTTYGTDTLSVSVPSTTTYSVWVRMQAPSTTSNEFMLQLDNSNCYTMGGDSSITPNTWTWVNYQDANTSSLVQSSLTAGNHTIELIGTESGVSIDRVLLLSDSSCTPTGTGDNCVTSATSPPTVVITAPAPVGSATVNGTSVPLTATATDTGSITQVQFQVDGTTVGTDTSSPYSVNWDSTTVANGTHTLKVTATDAVGLPASVSSTFTVANNGCTGLPSTPTLTGSSTSPTQVKLTWTPSTAASGCTLSGYTVYQGATIVGTSQTTSLTLDGLAPSSIYSYTVVAADTDGHDSLPSSPDVITTQADTTSPTDPTSPVVSAPSSGEVDLSWGASTDNVAVAYYRIYRNGSIYYTTPNATTLSYKDYGVGANTTYTYLVSAVDTSNNESNKVPTSPATITTPSLTDTTKPTTPTNLHTTLVSSSSVVLAWTPSTDNVGVVGYRIERSTGNATPYIIATSLGTTPSYTDSTVAASTTYNYQVFAFDAAGNESTNSSLIQATTLASSAPTCSLAIFLADNGYSSIGILPVSLAIAHYKQAATCAQGNINGDPTLDALDISLMLSYWPK